MKKDAKILAITMVLLMISLSVFPQIFGTASAAATIIIPIAISKTADMNFGNIAISGTLGTVVLSPASSRVATGGVTLPATLNVGASQGGRCIYF
jgi:hypothetical protein